MIPSSSSQTDARGVPVSTCDDSSLDDYETALYQFQSYFGDPTETLAQTLQNDPGFIIGHIFNANAMMIMGERQYLAAAKQNLEAAEALSAKANQREKHHLRATRQWLQGDWDQACLSWDLLLADYPQDALAIQCAHLTDFYLGDALNLRDRVGRVIGQWHEDDPGYSYILGMQAFGFEECNQFERAEETALAALAMQPRDGWSVHAATHVMEMQNRYQDGQKFLRSRSDDWAPGNGFAFHNWWHLGLFHLEEEDYAGALQVYDEQVWVDDSDVCLQLCDASALLWRLYLRDQDLGPRWQALADLWQRKIPFEDGYYAFNDFHAVMALLGAGRIDAAETQLKSLQASLQKSPRLGAMMVADVGLPACTGLVEFAKGNYAAAVEQLLPLRRIASRFGGSNAQRDVISQTLIAAALRAGQTALARNLVNERMVHKPFSPLSKAFQAGVAQ